MVVVCFDPEREEPGAGRAAEHSSELSVAEFYQSDLAPAAAVVARDPEPGPIDLAADSRWRRHREVQHPALPRWGRLRLSRSMGSIS